MAVNPRFQVRDTEEELQKLDKALKILNYSDRSAWYKEMKRQTIIEAEKKKSE